MPKYTYLLFDADDTLLDFERNGARAFTLLCAKYHLPCTQESRELFESFNQPLWRKLEQGLVTKAFMKVERFRLFLTALHRSDDPAAVNEDFVSFLGSSSFLTPHAEEVCKLLSQDHQIYILTNALEAVHTNRIQQSLLAPYIQGNFISESIGYEKPHKAYFDYVFSHIPGITKENCLLIGDSLTSDMQGGVNAGIPVCWYNPGQLANTSVLSIDYEIRDLLELPALVN